MLFGAIRGRKIWIISGFCIYRLNFTLSYCLWCIFCALVYIWERTWYFKPLNDNQISAAQSDENRVLIEIIDRVSWGSWKFTILPLFFRQTIFLPLADIYRLLGRVCHDRNMARSGVVLTVLRGRSLIKQGSLKRLSCWPGQVGAGRAMRETEDVIRTLVQPENYGAIVPSFVRTFVRSFARCSPFVRVRPQPGFIPRNYRDKGPP